MPLINVGSVAVDIVPSAKGFQQRLDAAIRSAQVKVEAVLEDTGIRERLTEITRDATVNIRADVNDANAKIKLAELGRSRTANVNVDLDDAVASAKMATLASNRTATVNVDADTGSATAQLAAFSGEAGVGRSAIQALIAAGIAIAPAIVPAAAAGAAAIAGIGSAAVAGVGGIAVLTIGLRGVVSAVSEVVKAQDASGAAAQAASAAAVAAAQRQESAQVALKSAQAGLANAQAAAGEAAVRSADAVRTAQEGVRTATQQAAQGVAAAIANEAAAERNLQSALLSEKQAQDALSESRRQAKRDLEDLTNQVKDGALAQRQAALDVKQAQKANEEAQAAVRAPGLTPQQKSAEAARERAARAAEAVEAAKVAQQVAAARLAAAKTPAGKVSAQAAVDRAAVRTSRAQAQANKLALEAAKAQKAAIDSVSGQARDAALQAEQAQLNYEQAIQRQKELAVQQQRLAEQQRDAQKKGVDGSDRVQETKGRIRDAEGKVGEARAGVQDAGKAVADARVAAAQRVAKAEKAVADARRAQDAQQRQSAFSVAQAQQQVANSQRSLEAAYTRTGGAANTAGKKAQDALSKLTPQGRELVGVIVGSIIPGFQRLSNVAQAPIALGALAGLAAARPVLSVLTPLVETLGRAMGELLTSAGRALGSPFWINFFRVIQSIAIPSTRIFGGIIGGLAKGFAGLLVAFAPAGQQIGQMLLTLAQRFAAFGTGKTEGFKRFFAYVAVVGPQVAAFIGSVARAAGHLLVALAPIGGVGLAIIKGLLDRISAIPTDTLTRLIASVIGVAVAITGLKTAFGALSTVTGLLTAGPLGIAALVIGGLALGFLALYNHSESFRKLVQTQLLPTLSRIGSVIRTAVLPVLATIGGAFLGLIKRVIPIVLGIVRAVIGGIKDNLPALKGIFTEVASVITQAGQLITAIWAKIGPIVLPIIRNLVGLIINVIGEVVKIVSGILGILVGLFTGNFDKVKEGARKVFEGVRQIITSALNFVIKTMKLLTAAVIAKLLELVQWVATKFRSGFSAVAGFITAPVKAGYDAARKKLGELQDRFHDLTSWLASKFRAGLAAVEGFVLTPIRAARDKFVAVREELKDRFTNFTSWLADKFAKAAAKVTGFVLDPMRSARDALKKIFDAVAQKFSDGAAAIGSAWDAVKAKAKDPIRFVVQTVLENGILKAFRDIAGLVGLDSLAEKMHVALPQGFESGGRVKGKTVWERSGTDRIPAMLDHDEQVINKRSTRSADRSIPGGLDYLNRTGLWPVGPVAETAGANQQARPGPTVPVNITGVPGNLQEIARRGPRRGDPSGYGANPVGFGLSHVGDMGWYNRCLAFVNAAWDYTVGRFRLPTARASMNAGPRTTEGRPPAGAGVYWDTGPSGHIALAVGDGTVVSNDIRQAGRLDRVPQQEINKWGPYRGWWHPNNLQPGAGDFNPGGGGGEFVDVAARLREKIAGPLKLVSQISGGPFGQIVGKFPGILADGMIDKVTNVAGNVLDAGKNAAKTLAPAAWAPVLTTALKMNGLPLSLLDNWISQVRSESGGNPLAVQQIRDINSGGNEARGLLQVIPPTFAAYKSKSLPNDIFNPLSNSYAAMNYARHRYSNLEAVIGHGHGYDQGGYLQPGTTIVHNNTGKPEPVFNPAQWELLRDAQSRPMIDYDALASAVAGQMPDHFTITDGGHMANAFAGQMARQQDRNVARG